MRRGPAPKLTLEERTKRCERSECGDYFLKPANTTRARWERRRFCSHRCWWASRGNWSRYAARGA